MCSINGSCLMTAILTEGQELGWVFFDPHDRPCGRCCDHFVDKQTEAWRGSMPQCLLHFFTGPLLGSGVARTPYLGRGDRVMVCEPRRLANSLQTLVSQVLELLLPHPSLGLTDPGR